MIESKKVSIEKRVVIILAAVLITSIIYAKRRIEVGPTPAKMAAGVVLNFDDISGGLAKISKLKVEEIENRRDPLVKPQEIAMLEAQAYPVKGPFPVRDAEKTGEELRLEGLVWGGKNKLAIISGVVVSEGELVHDAKVLSISEDKVVLLKNNSRIELKR